METTSKEERDIKNEELFNLILEISCKDDKIHNENYYNTNFYYSYGIIKNHQTPDYIKVNEIENLLKSCELDKKTISNLKEDNLIYLLVRKLVSYKNQTNSAYNIIKTLVEKKLYIQNHDVLVFVKDNKTYTDAGCAFYYNNIELAKYLYSLDTYRLNNKKAIRNTDNLIAAAFLKNEKGLTDFTINNNCNNTTKLENLFVFKSLCQSLKTGEIIKDAEKIIKTKLNKF